MLTENEFREIAEHSPMRLLHLAAKSARLEAERRLSDLELSSALFPYLLALYWQDGRSQRELSDLTSRDPGTTVRCLDQLEARGFVKRKTSPQDRRLYHVFLTPKGKGIQKELLGRLLEVRRAAFAGFRGKETEDFFSSLERVILNLDGNPPRKERKR
jgi:DNA-binding MarR family transcriptional regulator